MARINAGTTIAQRRERAAQQRGTIEVMLRQRYNRDLIARQCGVSRYYVDQVAREITRKPRRKRCPTCGARITTSVCVLCDVRRRIEAGTI